MEYRTMFIALLFVNNIRSMKFTENIGQILRTAVEIHSSSISLAPYLLLEKYHRFQTLKDRILISTIVIYSVFLRRL